MRKILRKMYRNHKRIALWEENKYFFESWQYWTKHNGPKRYMDAIEHRTAKA